MARSVLGVPIDAAELVKEVLRVSDGSRAELGRRLAAQNAAGIYAVAGTLRRDTAKWGGGSDLDARDCGPFQRFGFRLHQIGNDEKPPPRR